MNTPFPAAWLHDAPNAGPAEVSRRAAAMEATLRAALADVERILAQRDPDFAERLARRQAQREAA